MGVSSADDAAARYGYADVKPLTDRLLAMLREEMGDDLVGVALYGSVARGEARSASDVDLFLVHRGSRVAARTAFTRVVLALEDDPVSNRLQSEGIPFFVAAIFRAEETLPDTPWLMLDLCHHGIILFDPRDVLRNKVSEVRAGMAELGSRRVELADGSWYWILKPDLRPGEKVVL